MKTELRSLRLSRYHLKIVDELQKENGYTFTDAIKHIINEFSKIDHDKNSIKKFLQKLEKNLGNLNPPATRDPVVKSHELFDGLNEIGNNIRLILKALLIIGSADSRTLIDIENLLKEDE